jgi:hypothetical protein
MSSPDVLLDMEAEKHIDMDRLVDAYREPIIERVKRIIAEPEQRNPYMWEYIGDVMSEAFNLAQIPDRNTPWLAGYGRMVEMAWQQAFVEIVIVPLLNQAEYYGDKIGEIAKALSPEQLKQAATQGVGEARRDAARSKATNVGAD